jgi:hypothetical protein
MRVTPAADGWATVGGRGGGTRTHDLVLPKHVRYHCATPRRHSSTITRKVSTSPGGATHHTTTSGPNQGQLGGGGGQRSVERGIRNGRSRVLPHKRPWPLKHRRGCAGLRRRLVPLRRRDSRDPQMPSSNGLRSCLPATAILRQCVSASPWRPGRGRGDVRPRAGDRGDGGAGRARGRDPRDWSTRPQCPPTVAGRWLPASPQPRREGRGRAVRAALRRSRAPRPPSRASPRRRGGA